MKQCRGHIVLLFLPAAKTFDSGKEPFPQHGGRGDPLGVANRLQPLDSELVFLSGKCIRDPIRAEEHRITCLQSQGQRLVARSGE